VTGLLAASSCVLAATASADTYTPGATYATGRYPTFVTFGDLNIDGRPDVVAANGQTSSDFGDSTVSVRLAGAIPGVFLAKADFHTGGNPLSVAIEFGVATAARVRLVLLDLQGREVARLADGTYAPGRHHVQWDGRDARGPVEAGVYFVRYETPAGVKTSRFVIAR